MTEHRYIYRKKPAADQKSGASVVQVPWQGKIHSKTFSDKKFGGEKEALSAAIAHRNNLMNTFGITSRLQKPDSPHPGVSRTESERVSKSNGKLRTDAHWQAYWTNAAGKEEARRFSIKKLGEEGAKQAALETRSRAIQAIALGEDPFFEAPQNINATLWRYMDLTRFVSLLEDSALFFSAPENFEDPYEGSLSQANKTSRNFVHSRTGQIVQSSDATDRIKVVVSCWYAAQHESAAMWNLYAKSTDAIAICTTYKKLRQLLPPVTRLGLIKYVNYKKAWIPEDRPLHRFMHKRLSFQHEHELRALIDLGAPEVPLIGQEVELGLKVPIDLNRLLNKIYVAPKSAEWFLELVERICIRYGLKQRPVRSSLYDDPVE